MTNEQLLQSITTVIVDRFDMLDEMCIRDRLRPERPMVLHWRRCGRVGGRQNKKRKRTGFTSD